MTAARRKGSMFTSRIASSTASCPLVERPGVAVGPEVELERLELDALLVRHVADLDGGEVGLAGARAQARELGAIERNEIVPFGMGIGEDFELPGWFDRHARILHGRMAGTKSVEAHVGM